MLETVHFALIIILWVMCPFLIGLILLQGGAGDMSSAFGGGGALDSTLGVGAGRKMSKLTGWLAFAFLAIVAVVGIPHGSVARRVAKIAPASTTEATKPTESTVGGSLVPSAASGPQAGAPAPAAAAPVAPDAAAAAPAAVPFAPVPAPEVPPAGAAPVVPTAPVPAAEVPAAAAPAAPAPAKSALTVE